MHDLELSTEVCHAIENAVADRTLELRQAIAPLVALATASVQKGAEWADDAPWAVTDGAIVTWGQVRRLVAVWAGTTPLEPFSPLAHLEKEAIDRARFSGPHLKAAP